ncbi:ARF-GAP domain 8 [Striga asiatica]|uniref:ARF-GAP domain 8 n=1 Tax=Striga asiatica TaxID=4170 RepID=A0A5A7PT10_STRAF|nr:ARF-GAP domain 8 [Striga asiatica]
METAYICMIGKTPAKPSAFSINSSIGIAAIDSSLSCPNREDDGYISTLISQTINRNTFRALLIVSALSCLGGSKSGKSPKNFHGPPALSFLPSGTSCRAQKTVANS